MESSCFPVKTSSCQNRPRDQIWLPSSSACSVVNSAIRQSQLAETRVMTAIEGGESLAVLLPRPTDKGVAKLEGMATALTPTALARDPPPGGVEGHGGAPR